jgi:hypothetical protein
MEHKDIIAFYVLENITVRQRTKSGVDSLQFFELVNGTIDELFIKTQVGDSHRR